MEDAYTKVKDLLKSKATTLRDVLSGPLDRDIMTVSPEATIRDAATRITANPIGSVVVVDKAGVLVGIISEKDIAREISKHGADAVDKSVSSVMTPNPICGAPDTSTRDVLITMARGRFRHMPVVENGELLGIVMSLDVAHARLTETTTESMAMNIVLNDLPQAHGHCGLDEDVDTVLERMNTQGVRGLPVRDGEKIIGVIASHDILKSKIKGGLGGSGRSK